MSEFDLKVKNQNEFVDCEILQMKKLRMYEV